MSVIRSKARILHRDEAELQVLGRWGGCRCTLQKSHLGRQHKRTEPRVWACAQQKARVRSPFAQNLPTDSCYIDANVVRFVILAHHVTDVVDHQHVVGDAE